MMKIGAAEAASRLLGSGFFPFQMKVEVMRICVNCVLRLGHIFICQIQLLWKSSTLLNFPQGRLRVCPSIHYLHALLWQSYNHSKARCECMYIPNSTPSFITHCRTSVPTLCAETN